MALDLLREMASYPGLAAKLLRFQSTVTPEKVFYGPDRRQYYLHFPPAVFPRDTVVVYIHGGGWNKGSPRFFSFVGQCLALQGYRCILPGYRLAPRYHFSQQLEDVCIGTRAALADLDRQGIDARHVVVMGSSAGAQLGALLCYDKDLAARYRLPRERFQGFAGLGGPYRFDLGPALPLKWLSQTMLGQDDPLAAQPYHRLTAGEAPPMLVIQGTGDGVVNYACGASFYQKALALGIPAQFYAPPRGADSHSVYVAGCFLEGRRDCPTLDVLLRWLEERAPAIQEVSL